MSKIYIVRGYNSYAAHEVTKAFTTEKEAESFAEGLTNPYVHVVKYKSTIELVNYFLKRG